MALTTRQLPGISRIAAVVAIIFGIMTTIAGTSVLLDLGQARAGHPHYVPFVLWFNTISGLVYVAAGIGLWLRRRWAAWLAWAVVAGLVLIALGFGLHVTFGGAHDRSTFAALALRIVIWTAIASYARHALLMVPARLEGLTPRVGAIDRGGDLLKCTRRASMR